MAHTAIDLGTLWNGRILLARGALRQTALVVHALHQPIDSGACQYRAFESDAVTGAAIVEGDTTKAFMTDDPALIGTVKVGDRMHAVWTVEAQRQAVVGRIVTGYTLHDKAAVSLQLGGSQLVVGLGIDHRPFGMGGAMAGLAEYAGVFVGAQAIEHRIAVIQLCLGKTLVLGKDRCGLGIPDPIGLQQTDTVSRGDGVGLVSQIAQGVTGVA